MRYVPVIFALVLIFAPVTTHAAFDFVQIVPSECRCESVAIEGGSGTTSSAPGFGCVMQVLQNVIRMAITFGFVVATFALVYAGFMWMTSGTNAERRNQGSHLLLNVFIGIFIMLGAWLLIDFVMKAIYNDQSEFGPWNNILAGSGESANLCLTARQPVPLTDGVVGIITDVSTAPPSGGGTGVSTPGTMTDAQARAALSAGGVSIHTWNATRSLAGTRNDTINQAIEIKRACGCEVLVTATTGGSHATTGDSHGEGFKIDLEDKATLNSFFESRLIRSGNRGSDARYLDRCGNEYVYENAGRSGSHWDITVNRGVCSL